MEAFLIYIFKSSILLSIFYLVYYAFLRKDTFFNINRHFLLVGIITSLLLPFLEFTTIKFIEAPDFYIIDTNTTLEKTPISESINWWFIGLSFYLLGVLILLSRFGVQLFSLRKLLTRNRYSKKGEFNFIEVEEKIAPFSFFSFIVYNPTLHSEKELNMIINHEKVHVKQYHTLDLLIINLLRVFLWVNPFVWFYKKEVEQNLEFIADREAINHATSKKEYQLTLVRVFTNNYASIVNNFYQSLIKKRIVMLNKQTSQHKKLWKITVILPLLSLFLWSFNTKEIIKIKDGNNISTDTAESTFFQKEGKKTVEFIINKNSSDQDFEKIKKTFKSDFKVDIKFTSIKRNSDKEITGIKVDIASQKSSANYALQNDNPINSFVITYNSETDNISIGQSANNDFVWIRKGGSANTIKIHTDDDETHEYIFANDDEKGKFKKIRKKDKHGAVIIEEIHGDSENYENHFEVITDDHKTFAYFIGNSGKEPIIFIDGKKASKKEMEKLKSDDIEKMEVSKGKSAIKKYGKKAEHGVIEITTKKKK